MEDDLNFFSKWKGSSIFSKNGRRPQLFQKWKKTSIFRKWKTPLIFWQMEDDSPLSHLLLGMMPLQSKPRKEF
jgi:hypothetical protein